MPMDQRYSVGHIKQSTLTLVNWAARFLVVLAEMWLSITILWGINPVYRLKSNMNNKLHPIGTKVYSFRDNPFAILEGEVVGHRHINSYTWHICRWYDPILDETYNESSFSVFLTDDEADKAHTRIRDLFFKYRITP